MAQTKIFKTEMNRALFDGGLTDSEERRKVLSMIVRNDSCLSILMVKDSECFSREKIRTFASIYSQRDYEERGRDAFRLLKSIPEKVKRRAKYNKI